MCFRYGPYWEDPWNELADFVLGFLGKRLTSIVGDDVSISIQVMPSGNIMGQLALRPGAAPRVEAALRTLFQEFSASQPRSLGCCGDRSDT